MHPHSVCNPGIVIPRFCHRDIVHTEQGVTGWLKDNGNGRGKCSDHHLRGCTEREAIYYSSTTF